MYFSFVVVTGGADVFRSSALRLAFVDPAIVVDDHLSDDLACMLDADDLPRVLGRDREGGHAEVGGRHLPLQGQDRACHQGRSVRART